MSSHTRPPPVQRSYSTPDEPTMATSPDFLLRKTPPPPATHRNGSSSAGGGAGKMVAIKVVLLDDSVTLITAQSKTLGRLIFDQICKQLNVLESDYFGLEYVDTNANDGITYWLDLEKRLSRQVGLGLGDPVLKFQVKFYTPDPSQLEEEFTRYLFSLQIKRDLANGVLVCNDNTAALMASFIVQAECGDFSEEDYADSSYLSVYKFVPHQNYELERKIRECHKKHIGQSPAEADLHLLETARRTEMYGIRLHPARDEDGVHLTLSVCHMGVLVFQNSTKINTFSWAKIRKISFKRKRFILKLHPETYGYYKELVEFIFDSRNECKAYWKRCVEHHAFFRCEKAPNPIHRSKGILSSRGSSFRYSGRTQKQMVQFVRENFIKRPPGQGQYLSQQNLSTFESQQEARGSGGSRATGVSQFQQEQFQRSSSFKSAQSSLPPQKNPPLLPATTRRSTGNMHDHFDKPNPDQNDEEDDIDDEEFSDYHINPQQPIQQPQQKLPSPTPSSLTSSPILQQQPPAQEQNLEAPYYTTKLLLNHYRTYTKDLSLLSLHLPHKILHPLLQNTLSLSPHFESNISSVKKHNWELKQAHGLIYKLAKHFRDNKSNYEVYFDHVRDNYEAICSGDSTNHYLGLGALVLRPFFWVQYNYGLRGMFEKLGFLRELVDYFEKGLGELLDIDKVVEVRRDVLWSGVGQVVPGSRFLRQGVVLKLNKKRGLQARMVFLFRDYLIYCTRISSSAGFRLHGLIKTSQMEISGEDCVSGIPHSWLVNVNEEEDGGGVKILVLAAFSEGEKTAWTSSLRLAISTTTSITLLPTKPMLNSSSEEFDKPHPPLQLPTHPTPFSRPNLPSHVCYHRSLSITSSFLLNSYSQSMSSYLLRKFKSSPGWQRLWVVYTNVCLYFYKSHEADGEENPLASLPLLGYKVSENVTEEEISSRKLHVFKLGFKNHTYFFRAESTFFYNLWVQVLRGCSVDE